MPVQKLIGDTIALPGKRVVYRECVFAARALKLVGTGGAVLRARKAGRPVSVGVARALALAFRSQCFVGLALHAGAVRVSVDSTAAHSAVVAILIREFVLKLTTSAVISVGIAMHVVSGAFYALSRRVAISEIGVAS